MKAEISGAEVMRGMTMNVKITGARVLAFRVRLGAMFIRIAAAVMGCGVKVEIDP